MDNLQVSINLPKQIIPIEQLIELREKGLTYDQIGKQVGCTSGNITQRFQSYGYDPNNIKAFNKYEPAILSTVRSKLLNSLRTEDIEKAPLQTKVWCYGVLLDKSLALERKASGAIADDNSMDSLSAQLARIASRSPVVINNILNVVGSLPGDVRDQVAKLIPQSLVQERIIDCSASD